MKELFYFEELDDDTTLVADDNQSFELDSERLKETLDRKSEVEELALEICKEDKDLYRDGKYPIKKEMRNRIEKELKKSYPELKVSGKKSPVIFLINHGVASYSNQPYSDLYYIYLMAMEYLGILDEFLDR